MIKILVLLLFVVTATYTESSAQVQDNAQLKSSTDKDLEFARTLFDGRLFGGKCGEATFDFPHWESFPVRRCEYSHSGVKVHTFMLNPLAEQISKWVVSACRDVKAQSIRACSERMAKVILEASSGIFPVSGYIPEPAASVGAKGTGVYCPLFRDGVTISTCSWNTNRSIGNSCGPENELQKPILGAKKFACIASTRRNEYVAAGGTENVGIEAESDPAWAEVIRKEFQKAWKSDKNFLIYAKALGEKTLGKIK